MIRSLEDILAQGIADKIDRKIMQDLGMTVEKSDEERLLDKFSEMHFFCRFSQNNLQKDTDT